VQDTGTDGAMWALAVRGAPPPGPDDLAFAWTWRGAPHAYRRTDLADVVVATAPLSEADAAKRIFDAAKPLNATGIPVLDALASVARHLREVVTRPAVKGEVSRRLAELLDEPVLRYCRACKATHPYEMTFRLPALQGGLELEPATSPPVLRRIPGLRPALYRRLGTDADPRFDAVRGYLRFFGPARVSDVAGFLDAPVKDVKVHWPADVREVDVADVEPSGKREPRFVLEADADVLAAFGPDGGTRTVRLVAPYDPYLQLRDRETLVPEAARRKELWPVLGRPGAILVNGEVAGTWRPRSAGSKLTVRIALGAATTGQRAAVEDEARRLADHRGVALAAVTED
ncbi:MAG: winged helix DNA-binding domain-containing protein, partial [Actinomycetota bacterium]|nr:winged helix DNA-binding domain-containing protein [Actinomycetota bacterium]